MEVQKKASIATIIELSAKLFKIPVSDLRFGGSRKFHVMPRYAVALVATEQGHSSQKIATALGDYDHTTILHGIRKAKAVMQSEREYRDCIDWLRQAAVATDFTPEKPIPSRRRLKQMIGRDPLVIKYGYDPDHLSIARGSQLLAEAIWAARG